LSALILSNTSPRIADPAGMEARRTTVLASGMQAVADTAMTRFFGKEADANPFASSARLVLLGTTPAGYAGCCAALRDADLHPLLEQIRTRTLIVSGDRDESMPWAGHGAVLAGRIAGATTVRLPTAHLSNLGAPRAFSRAVLSFLAPPQPDSPEAGMAVRRQVLGDAHVDRSIASATDLTRDFQALITRFPWAAIWTRPGLDHRSRRLLVLAITASLGRWEEFRLHLAAGIDHGLEWSDVEEVLLHTSAYAGIPVGNTAFKIAAEERARRQNVSSD
jgi:3-oxoadipate enol-lactonase / 4-carboxymuconolactone decarboxylase